MSFLIFAIGFFLSLATLVPLSIKWELEKKITIPATCFVGILTGAIATGFDIIWDLYFYQILILEIILIAVLSISLLLWRFYRDPERISFEKQNAVLSPADGEVIYVKKIEKGKIPFSDKKGTKFSINDFTQSETFLQGGHLIGIAMTYLDVHVNRAPIKGKIRLLKHIKGIFLSLKRKEAVVQNERTLIVIDNGHFNLGIVQIASRLVRKIVPYIHEGQEIERGERIGIIRFGSQVDVILPDLPFLNIEINPGDKVKAGLSVVATLKDKNNFHTHNMPAP